MLMILVSFCRLSLLHMSLEHEDNNNKNIKNILKNTYKNNVNFNFIY